MAAPGSGGNSGIFVWTDEAALKDLEPGSLPRGGIEVQVLDHGYTAEYEQSTGKNADWFTTNGDVFPVERPRCRRLRRRRRMGNGAFRASNLSKGVDEWNHYYVRCLNGKSGSGSTAKRSRAERNASRQPLVMSAWSPKGSRIDFRGLRIRELP